MDWPKSNESKKGWIETIAGCMYSGKSEELIRQLKRAQIAKLNIKVFKPKLDDRYSKTEVATHNLEKFPATVISHSSEIFQHIESSTQVIGIDEAQFFDNSIIKTITKLANAGKRVIIAGLDTNWKGEPFGPMGEILAVSEIVKKQQAICMTCGNLATHTQRMINNQSEVLVGSDNMYEARCRAHFDPNMPIKKQTQTKEEININIVT